MFHPVPKGRAVAEPASENGAHSPSQEAGVQRVTLAASERTVVAASRRQPRPAAGAVAGQTGRFTARGSTSFGSKGPLSCSLVKLEPLKEPRSSHRKKESTMPATAEPTYVGLDISKDRLDYALSDAQLGQCRNDPQGHAVLITQLRRLRAPRVICEASGGYEHAVVGALLGGGIEVCVVQAARVRAFAYAEGLLAKTDRIDARLLRRFGQKINARVAVPSDPAAQVLRDLLEHRRKLGEQLSEVQGRLPLASRTLSELLQRQRQFLETELAAVQTLIEEHIDHDPDLRQKSKRMQQLTGVGPILAATLLAHVPELGQLEGAKISALVGVAPFAKDTGATCFPRHIRAGRATVRKVLYMAAVCASQHNPVLRAFYLRLRQAGKPAKVCIVAVMRKLLLVLNRLIAEPTFVLSN